MKIYTITCHDVYNYGASLQAYALMKYLQLLGHDVEIIDYKPSYLSRHYALFGVGNPKYRKNFVLRLAYNVLKFPGRLLALRKKKIFDKYQESHLVRTSKRYVSNDELKTYLPQADAYICGSDQIWNPLFNNGKDKAFYLDFAPADKRKIAYAASMAVDAIPSADCDFMRQQIARLDSVSVRESTAVALLSDLGIEATRVMDPVFFHDKDFWTGELREKGKVYSQSGYIFVYDFDKNTEIKSFAVEFAKKNGLKIVTAFKSDYATLSLNLKDPNDFLAAINNADFVISNSFHATAFSIILQKQFAVVGRKEKVNSRMLDLLKLVGLQNRVLTDDFENVAIDYEKVEEALRMEIEKSKAFLEGALNDRAHQ